MIVEIDVNGRKIKARKGDRILDALVANGIHVPTLCHLEGFRPTGSCRICVVEVEGRADLVPACSYPVEEWMVLYTHSPRVVQARRTILELLLAEHPEGCLTCEKSRGCELQELASELNITARSPVRPAPRRRIDNTSRALIRDNGKCILCGRCIRICEEQQAVAALDFLRRGSRTEVGTVLDKGLNYSSCVNCGQCILVCPTGALKERSHLDEVVAALHDPGSLTVALVDPAVMASAAEQFRNRSGKELRTYLFSVLKRAGFKRVYENLWGVEQEASGLANWFLEQKSRGRREPVIMASCASFVQYVIQSQPELIPLLAPLRPARQLMPPLLRHRIAAETGWDESKIVIVYLTACTAAKPEAHTSIEPGREGYAANHILTAREMYRLIRLFGINMDMPGLEMHPDEFAGNTRSGYLPAISGGMVESVLRILQAGSSEPESAGGRPARLRGIREVREFTFHAEGANYQMASISGLANFRDWYQDLLLKKRQVDLVEVMACPGGCINGGGQPVIPRQMDLRSRAKLIFELDNLYSGITPSRNLPLPDGMKLTNEATRVAFTPREIIK
ncbi:MAG: [Fe-Fe] hydrogenase large subunit C-terminal domain-containing protein [Bacteroidales bacterium]